MEGEREVAQGSIEETHKERTGGTWAMLNTIGCCCKGRLSTVEYRDIPGFPGYKIGNDGSIISNHKSKGRFWKLLKPMFAKGYLAAGVYDANGKQFSVRNHVLVLEAFVGPRPPKHQACHNDGNRANATLSNLRWDTAKGNHADKLKHGTHQRGERNGHSRFTTADIEDILERLGRGETQRAVASLYGTVQGEISNIKRGKSWAHIGRDKVAGARTKVVLKDDQRSLVRSAIIAGGNLHDIAKAFGVSWATVWRIQNKMETEHAASHSD